MAHRLFQQRRRGSIVVLSAIMLIVALGLLLLCIDLGCLVLARTEAQRTADASALASAGMLLEQRAHSDVSRSAVVRAAVEYGKKNPVGGGAINVGNSNRDFSIGALVDGRIDSSSPAHRWNAVQISVQLDGGANAKRPLQFGKFFNRHDAEIGARATAIFADRFKGFRAINTTPKESGNAPLLPFTYPLEAWREALAGRGPDDFRWNDRDQTLTAGRDGKHEVVLYPLDKGGGNFGGVDIGGNNSNTPRLRSQIEKGVTVSDLAYHGGAIELDAQGRVFLSADPGLKAGAIQGALRSILGQPRIIPLHTDLSGQGQNATYEIRAFAGVRVVEVELTGSHKRVIIQPASVVTRTGIAEDSGPERSFHIFSPVRLFD